MEYSIQRISNTHIDIVWPSVSCILERAVRRCKDDTMENVFDECKRDDAQLWIVLDGKWKIVGAFVTEVLQGPARRVIEIRYLSGIGFNRWVSLISEVFLWGKLANCDTIRFKGRRGWERFWRGSGWHVTAIEMEHSL